MRETSNSRYFYYILITAYDVLVVSFPSTTLGSDRQELTLLLDQLPSAGTAWRWVG